MRISDWSSDVCSSDLQCWAPTRSVRRFHAAWESEKSDISLILESRPYIQEKSHLMTKEPLAYALARLAQKKAVLARRRKAKALERRPAPRPEPALSATQRTGRDSEEIGRAHV